MEIPLGGTVRVTFTTKDSVGNLYNPSGDVMVGFQAPGEGTEVVSATFSSTGVYYADKVVTKLGVWMVYCFGGDAVPVRAKTAFTVI